MLRAARQQGQPPSSSAAASSGGAAGGASGGGGPAWMMALAKYASHPERADPSVVVSADSQVVVVRDAFPKGRLHLLVVARRPGLDSVLQLVPSDLPLLRHMRETGRAAAAAARAADPGPAGLAAVPVRLGFHAKPSMKQLHLHVISADLEGPKLKHKQHYNSFATAFFVPIDGVITALEREEEGVGAAAEGAGVGGGLREVLPRDAEAVVKGPLPCLACGRAFGGLAEVKAHWPGCAPRRAWFSAAAAGGAHPAQQEESA